MRNLILLTATTLIFFMIFCAEAGPSEKTPGLNGPGTRQCDSIKSASDLNLEINGHVKKINGEPIEQVDVNFYNKKTMTLQDEVFTDANGYYDAPFIYVGQQEHKKPNLEDKLYPNPSHGQTNLVFNSKTGGDYLLQINDALGRQVYTSTVHADAGANKITIAGGNIGMYLINLMNTLNKSDIHTFKSIQTENISSNFTNTKPTQVEQSELKSATTENPAVLDSTYATFSKNGFITKDTTFAPTTTTIDETLLQGATFSINTTFKPYDVNGNPANITITAHWPDGTTNNYSPNTNNEIIIQKDLYTSTANATLELDSVSFANNQQFLGWLIGRKIHQARQDSNIFQSPKEWGQFPQPVVVDMSNPDINDKTIYTYVVNKYGHKDMNSGTPGDSIRMDAEPIREMMAGRVDNKTHKFIDVNVSSLLPFYKIQCTYSSTDPNTQISTTQLDRAKALSEMTDTLSIIPNTNDTLMVPHTFHRATSPSDAILVQCQTRGSNGGDQYTRIAFGNVLPGNSVFYKNNYTYNNTVRESWGFAVYGTGDTDGVIFGEYFDLSASVGDPNSGPTAAAYVWSQQNHTSSDLGKKMLRTIYLLNLDTKYY